MGATHLGARGFGIQPLFASDLQTLHRSSQMGSDRWVAVRCQPGGPSTIHEASVFFSACQRSTP